MLFPLYSSTSIWTGVVSAAVLAALAWLVAREWRERREIEGATRRAYTG